VDSDAPGRPDPRTPDRLAIDIAVRLSLLGLFAYFALSLMAPFLSILLWSIVLSVALYPVFAWVRDRLGGRPKLAAALITFATLSIVLGPTTVLVSSLIHTLETLAMKVHGGSLAIPAMPPALAEIPIVGPGIATGWTQATTNLEAFLTTYRSALLGAGEWVLHAVAGLAGSVLVIVVAVLISGFLYFPGPRFVTAFRAFASRVVGPHGSDFVDLAGATIRNVARGVIGVAAIQALLIGVGLIVAGVPAAGLLTMAVLVLAILQIGSGPVVVPLLIWAWIQMPTPQALLVTAYMVPVSVIDNVLKPMLMGKGLPTPMLVILMGVIGGTISYGLIGLFLGPIVLAVFYELIVYWVAAETEAPAAGPPAVPEEGGGIV
jgi:predicted PurR-regulated permease PerM